jgi:conjugative transfer region lipoprotein (TIGR03751 family)
MLSLIKIVLVSLFIVFIAGCTSMSSVMPKQSLTMEKIYDDTGKTKTMDENVDENTEIKDDNLTHMRKEVSPAPSTATSLSENVPAGRTCQSFHKVSNPMLKLYVYPHLAGNNELPVPGYTTAFNAYEKDHYSLPSDQPY